jgi:hypothetical protein
MTLARGRDFLERRAHRAGDRIDVTGGSHRNGSHRSGGLRKRHIVERFSGIVRTGEQDVACHTDDLQRAGGLERTRVRHQAADGIGGAEKPACRRFTQHRDPPGPGAVRIRNGAAAEDGSSHGFEISRRYVDHQHIVFRR